MKIKEANYDFVAACRRIVTEYPHAVAHLLQTIPEDEDLLSYFMDLQACMVVECDANASLEQQQQAGYQRLVQEWTTIRHQAIEVPELRLSIAGRARWDALFHSTI
jgi:hypothetical protein